MTKYILKFKECENVNCNYLLWNYNFDHETYVKLNYKSKSIILCCDNHSHFMQNPYEIKYGYCTFNNTIKNFLDIKNDDQVELIIKQNKYSDVHELDYLYIDNDDIIKLDINLIKKCYVDTEYTFYDYINKKSFNVYTNTPGIITERTLLNLKTNFSSIESVKKNKFDIYNLGGLSDVYDYLFTNILYSRFKSIDIIKKMNISHTYGILIYGKSGTGKTTISKLFNKILPNMKSLYVNCSDIMMDKIVETKKIMHDIFIKNNGIIIFDNLELISNEILVKYFCFLLDKNKNNDRLIIGITESISSLDNSILRSGRLDFKVELQLPTQKERVEIIKIYLNNIDNNLTDEFLYQLSSSLDGFSGADIEFFINKIKNNLIKNDESVLEEYHFQNILEEYNNSK